ncbi:MAG: alpha/beta fold hydrolase [Planctomycetia bacterium]|nr:alpha/beta fold hydrolase [Planctomycetia bacterium]
MSFVLLAAALVANMLWVDTRTRIAAPRDGGKIVENAIEPANVKVEGTGPPILLIHGFGAAMDWWDEIAPVLARNHRVVRIDLIGHGGTAAPASGYEITRQAQMAAAVLDKLGIDRVTVIGHSMGGEVAVAFAALKPARIERLVLIDSPAIAGTHFTVLANLYLTPVIGEALSHLRTARMARRALAQAFAPNFPVPERFVADLKQLPYIAFRKAHEDSAAFRTTQPTYKRLAELKPVPPLLVIFGSLDAIVPVENAKLFDRVPGARVEIIDGVGHSPIVESPAQTVKLIEEFLK